MRTTPRKEPRQERARGTVEALLDAAAKLLVKDGYDRVSTNRIAVKANVSVGSLYQYFPNKEALVAALVDRHTQAMAALAVQAMAQFEDAPLRVAIRGTVEAIASARALDPRLSAVIKEQVPRVGRLQKLSELHDEVAMLVKGQLERRKAELRVKDLDLAALFLVETVEALLSATMDGRRGDLGHDRVVTEITDLAVCYLGGSGPGTSGIQKF